MSPKFVNFEIILLYFLLLIPWPPSQVIKLICSQDNSRLVRKIVRSKWTPILDKYQVKLPLECPLHPFRDLFAPRQDAKKRDRPTQWTCRLCGKSFYQEKFLDLHFETRHKSTVNEAEDAVCFADLCDIMRCEVFQTEESSSLKTGDQHVITDIEVWGDSLGQNSALAKANAVYLSLMPLRTSAIGATRAAKVQNRQLCQDKIGQSKFKDTVDSSAANEKSKINTNDATRIKDAATIGSSAKGTHSKHSKTNKSNSAKVNHKNLSDEPNGASDDSTDSADNRTQNGNQDNGNNMQKVRSNCKPDELSKLKTKCEYLVRSCIGGLLLSMSDQSFKEMEEEMNKAVCWYLSCDRYWEDGPLEPRAFPWGLILILILVLSTGICFCYYIIWILFDTEETTINSNQHMYMPPYAQYPGPAGTVGGTHGPGQQQQPYYYQQQQSVHDLYPDPPQYDYRHSPRRYIDEQRLQGTAGTTTPLHHHSQPHQTNLAAYQQDILDRRDYTSSLGRPIATTAVSSAGGSGIGGLNVSATNISTTALNAASGGTGAGAGAVGAANVVDCDINAMGMAGGSGIVGGKHHYNTHPRPLDTHHRHASASQQSLRGSSSTHEIIQNEVGHNEHYIYVTYPPDLKKRFFEKYE